MDMEMDRGLTKILDDSHKSAFSAISDGHPKTFDSLIMFWMDVRSIDDINRTLFAEARRWRRAYSYRTIRGCDACVVFIKDDFGENIDWSYASGLMYHHPSIAVPTKDQLKEEWIWKNSFCLSQRGWDGFEDFVERRVVHTIAQFVAYKDFLAQEIMLLNDAVRLPKGTVIHKHLCKKMCHLLQVREREMNSFKMSRAPHFMFQQCSRKVASARHALSCLKAADPQ